MPKPRSHRSVATLLTTLLAVVTAVPAGAEPGQTVAQFTAWARAKPQFFSNLESRRNEMSGMPEFHARGADHGISWDLQAETAGTTISRELFGVSETTADPGSAPIRHDGTGYGFTFFRSVYGAAVASDYRTAKPFATVTDAKAGMKLTFYEGKRFGYVTTDRSGVLEIDTLARFASGLAQARYCAKHPEDCNE